MSLILKPGDVIAGKYRVERVLGEGAMGVVLLAQHLQLDEWVAIKVPLPAALEQPESAARFLREARAAVRIKSEYVARVSDVGTLDSGEPFMVMEYLEGQDLATWLAERGALPIEQAVEFVVQACEALADAHSLGIVHRDLKPANLFSIRRSDGVLAIKVLDFGISKLISGVPEGAMTGAGTLMGSPFYMSPEQLVSSSSVDVRSDIWSIGVILYELVSKQPPFLGDSLVSLGMKITHSAPPKLSSLRADVPPELEAVIERCLAKDRTARFANVAELARALLPFAPPRASASVERTARIIQASSAAGANSSGAHAVAEPPLSTLIESTPGSGDAPKSPRLLADPFAALGDATTAFGNTAGAPRRTLPRWWLVVGLALVLGAAVAVWPTLSHEPPPIAIRSGAPPLNPSVSVGLPPQPSARVLGDPTPLIAPSSPSSSVAASSASSNSAQPIALVKQARPVTRPTSLTGAASSAQPALNSEEIPIALPVPSAQRAPATKRPELNDLIKDRL